MKYINISYFTMEIYKYKNKSNLNFYMKQKLKYHVSPSIFPPYVNNAMGETK